MKILICGEGPHDVGRTKWNAKAKAHGEEEGWLQPIVRHISGPEATLVRITHKDAILLPRTEKKHRPLPKGHGARALAAKFRAVSEGCSLVIFMADADTPD